jgi:hypothetical protein
MSITAFDMGTNWTGIMRALKALVIGMGILIILGIALVGYGVYRRGQAPEPPKPVAAQPPVPQAPAPPPPAPSPPKPYGPIAIAMPPGSRVIDSQASNGRLVVELELLDGSRRNVVVDLATGALIGTIDLKPQP